MVLAAEIIKFSSSCQFAGIPLVVRNFPKGKLQQPLSRKHARDAHDL
jgi:hypothetical protein